MSDTCKDCIHYEPFSVFWSSEKWHWIDDETAEGERQGLEEFDEVARSHHEEHWKLRRWGRCLLAESKDGSLVHPESTAMAIDPCDKYYADYRCSPEHYCNQHKGK